MLSRKAAVVLLLCISIELITAQGRRWSRLCERMTMCDLNRFTRTHTKQIATVKNTIQNADALLNELQNRSSNILGKLDVLEEMYEKIKSEDTALIAPRSENEDLGHEVAMEELKITDGNLNEDIMTLKYVLEGAKDEVGSTLTDARNQQNVADKLKKELSEKREFLNPLVEFVGSYKDGVGVEDDKTEDAVEVEANQLAERQTALEETLQKFLLQYAFSERQSQKPPASKKDLKLANAELDQIKSTLSSLVLQVDKTKHICISKNIGLAAELNALHSRIKALGSRESPCLCW